MNDESGKYPEQTPLAVALACSCPRCGEGRLYDGLLAPAERCRVCGLDYGFIDSGDGPAVFVILILGFVFLGLALAVESAVSPPLWVHIVIWVPLVTILSVWGLRVGKALLVALQYRTSAREGRIEL